MQKTMSELNMATNTKALANELIHTPLMEESPADFNQTLGSNMSKGETLTDLRSANLAKHIRTQI